MQSRSALVYQKAILILFIGAALLLHSCSKTKSGSEGEGASYSLGTAISFGTSGNAAQYEVSGWSSAEPDHTWSDKTLAIIQMQVQPADQALELHATMAGLVKPPELLFQPVEVKINGETIASWQVAAEADYVATIPEKLARKSTNMRIQFSIPKAASPKSLGIGSDERALGINIAALRISVAGR